MLNNTVQYYKERGYECIPVKPDTKRPWGRNWQNRTIENLWKVAPAESVYGLRGGGGKAYIDCDNSKNPETFDMIVNWLDGLGHKRGSYPVVASASGIGRHIYVNQITNMLGSSRHLKIGTGEFRYGQGAHVVAPPSVIDGREYKLIAGNIERLPTLEIRDIEQLIKYPGESRPTEKNISALAQSLMMGETPEGKYYRSRSDSDQALITSLVNSGYEFHQIKSIFDSYPTSGKYHELHAEDEKNAARWLLLSYEKAKQFAERVGEVKEEIRRMMDVADSFPFSTISEKLVMFAHMKKAYKAASMTYHVSSRELGVSAGMDRQTAADITKGLLLKGYLTLAERWKFEGRGLSNAYGLDNFPHILTQYVSTWGLNVPAQAQVTRDGVIIDLDDLEASDAFRNRRKGKGGLGRSAGQIYKILFIESLTVPEIAERVKLTRKQVNRILKRLATVKDYKTGEVIQMVSRGGDNHWYSNAVDLELIEAIYGTRGARAKQAHEYEMERDNFNRWYKKGKD